jgi:hypothetical protein
MPRRSKAERDARLLTFSSLRALEEADGVCERCETRPGAVVAQQISDHIAVVCVNRPECARRVRRQVVEGEGGR